MNDDPRNIDVLYGCVQDDHSLAQKLADALVEYFYNAGIKYLKLFFFQVYIISINKTYFEVFYRDSCGISYKTQIMVWSDVIFLSM